jgi:hypothetical protein
MYLNKPQDFSCKILNIPKRRTVQILFPMIIIFLLTGCSAPRLIVESNTYNFADAEIGKSVAKDIVLENKGNANLKINNINISGDRYSQKKPAGEIIIYPNQKYILNVKFSPDESGNYSGIMSIYSNDPANKVMNLQFQGKGIEPKLPEIKVLTSTLDFLTVDNESVHKKTIGISNTGWANLVINNLVLNGDGFVIERINQNKIIIAPDESIDLNIEFRPLKPGSYSGVLSIVSNDSKNTTAYVSLRGESREKIKEAVNEKAKVKVYEKISETANETVHEPARPSTKPSVTEINPPPPRNTVENNYSNNAKNKDLGVFTHDEVQGTMKTEEGTMQKNSELSFSFEVQKTGDFEILITPGYELVSKEFKFTDISTFTDKSRYKRFIKEKVQPNSAFQVVIRRNNNSPDSYKFIFKLFPI